MRVIVSVCAVCVIVNSLPNPPPPRPPPRPPPPPPPPPPAGAAAAASATHLPEKSALACAARLAATPNISTTAMRKKFRRICLPPLIIATAGNRRASQGPDHIPHFWSKH